MKLSIIIPVYNEKKTMQQILERVSAVNLEGIEKEIIVIDDASTDGTSEILKANKINDVSVYTHSKNKGKGAAVKTGFKHVSGDLIIIQDADLEYDPKDYAPMINALAMQNMDVIYGSRFTNTNSNWVFPVHYLGNRFLSLLTSFLYHSKITDMETCYKLFKKEVIKNIEIKSNRFDFEPEITAKILKNGYSICEVPITYVSRNYKSGKKITIADGFIAAWTLIKYKFKD